MANRRSNPVIPFDYEPEKPKAGEFIKHQLRMQAQDNEDIIEDQIPKLSEEASPYEILQFLSIFQRVRRTMNWTTGPKLYQKFPVHLSGYHLDVWELPTNDRTATVANFNDQLQEFKSELLQGYTDEDQMDYLRTLKKPGNMGPSQFLFTPHLCDRGA